MIVLEHDAKELLAVQGFPVPGGIQLVQVPRYDKEEDDEPAGPWLVKAQIPFGVRDLAPGFRCAETKKQVAEATAQLLGTALNDHLVNAVRVERAIAPVATAYLSFACDPQSASIVIEAAAEGGVDAAELATRPNTLLREVVVPDPNAVIACVNRMAARLPADRRDPIVAAARQLAPLYFGYEALLIEINPLMILSDGIWTAGDVQMIIDESALFRHPEIISMIDRREHAYREVRSKRILGIDYCVVDPAGDVGMVNIGAGFGMMLLDELAQRGLRPLNYCHASADVLDADATPLTEVLSWIGEAPTVHAILVTVCDGVVDTAIFAKALIAALNELPALNIPIVARFAGNGAEHARAALSSAADRVTCEQDLEMALGRVARHVQHATTS